MIAWRFLTGFLFIDITMVVHKLIGLDISPLVDGKFYAFILMICLAMDTWELIFTTLSPKKEE